MGTICYLYRAYSGSDFGTIPYSIVGCVLCKVQNCIPVVCTISDFFFNFHPHSYFSRECNISGGAVGIFSFV